MEDLTVEEFKKKFGTEPFSINITTKDPETGEEKTEKVPASTGASMGLTAPFMAQSNNSRIYRTTDGHWTGDIANQHIKISDDTGVSLDKKTGKITVKAPSIALQNETFKKNVIEPLKTLSANYKANPNYKESTVNEKGETVEKSVDDIIADLNAEAKNSDGTLNSNSLKTLAAAAMQIESDKVKHLRSNGVKLTDQDIMTLRTVALGADRKDNTLQAISNLPEAWFLREKATTYNKETGTAQYKDLMENAWNRDKVSDEDIKKLEYALIQYFKKGDFSNADDYARNVATWQFIMSEDPSVNWWRDVGESIGGFINGIFGFATDLGVNALAATEGIIDALPDLGRDYTGAEFLKEDTFGQNMLKTVEGWFGIDIEKDGIYIMNNGVPERVDGKRAGIMLNDDGVPVYTQYNLEGAGKQDTLAGLLRNIFKENQADIRNDLKLLNDSAASADMVAYGITKVAALISAGNAVSGAATAAVGKAVGAAKYSQLVNSAAGISKVGETLFATGKLLDDSIEGITAITQGLGVIYDVAEMTGKAAKLVNSIVKICQAGKGTEFLVGVLGETFAEAIVGDPDRLVSVITNKGVSDDDKTYLMQEYVGNAIGFGIGMGAGKALMKAGKTARGQALSFNLSKKIFKVENAIGKSFDTALLKLRNIGGKDIRERIEALKKKGTARATKQANILSNNQLLRDIRQQVINMDSVKITGKSKDEVLAQLDEIQEKINYVRSMEVAIDSANKQGVDIIAKWLSDESNEISGATTEFYKQAGKVSDLEKNAGDMFKVEKGMVVDLNTGKTLKLFSQTTTNYIKASEKLAINNAYIKYWTAPEHAGEVTKTVTENLKKIEKENSSLELFIKTFNDNANAELKAAVNAFIDADTKWWNAYESLRADLGQTSKKTLEGMRKSGIWGEDGMLYAKTTRRKDASDYIISHRDGTFDHKTYSDFAHYTFGSEGDFVDPMAEMQFALRMAGSEEAYRNLVRTYGAATGNINIILSGKMTELAEQVNDKAIRDYKYFVANNGIDNIAEAAKANSNKIFERVGDLLKNKVEIKKSQNAAKKAIKTVQEGFSKEFPVDGTNAKRFVQYLDDAQTDEIWDSNYIGTVQDALSAEQVPTNVRRTLVNYGKSLQIEEFSDPNTIRKMTPMEMYNRINARLNPMAEVSEDVADAANQVGKGTEDITYGTSSYNVSLPKGTTDTVLDHKIKRAYIAQDTNITGNPRFQEFLSEQRKERQMAEYDTILRDRSEEYAELERQYGITVEELNVVGNDLTEAYIDSILGNPATRKVIDSLMEFHELGDDPNALRYFALSFASEHSAEFRKKMYDEFYDVLIKDGFSETEAKNIAGTLSKGTMSGLEVEFLDSKDIVREMNKLAVRADDEKMFSEVRKIQNEMEGAKKNIHGGTRDIIAMRNAQGQLEFIQTDPLLAGLVNFTAPITATNKALNSVYNINYLWSKLFRLGTTAINLKSMVSQTFKDPINAIVGGGVFKTAKNRAQYLEDVFGKTICDYLEEFEPKTFAKLKETAEETGESVAKLAVERELKLGKAMSPGSTETQMIREMRTAKAARSVGGMADVYDYNVTDKITNKISSIEDALGKPHEAREKLLRNWSYANGLADALDKGYTLAQARDYAKFIQDNATTNFARKMAHLTALQETVPYLGAAVNGSKSFWRLLSLDPVGVVGRLTGGIIIPTVALTAASAMNEHDKKIYKSIPEWQKQGAICFVVEGQVFSIPLPEELGAFVAPFREFTESLMGTSTNDFGELLFNNILGFSPINLDGFADLDYSKIESSSPGFMDRISRGITKMWAQLAPAPLKSAATVVTGIDPYTGRKIDTSYTTFDAEGNPIIVDYRSGLTAQLLNDMFQSWGINSSAPVVQNVLTNIFGSASNDILDFVASIGQAVITGKGWEFDISKVQANQGYNPFYVLAERFSSPVLVETYDEAQSAWKSEVTKLMAMKKQILESDAWSAYIQAKSKATSNQQINNLTKSKIDMVEKYFNEVKNSVINLQNNYGEFFTPAKYASVLSLMTMNEQLLDAGAYGEYLNKESYKIARAQGIQTMIRYGFPSANSSDILGYYKVNSDGNIGVETTSPLALLQLDDRKGSKLSSITSKQHFATIKKMVDNSTLYDDRQIVDKKISQAYDNKNYDEVERLINEYNSKVISLLDPYIKQYTAESVLRSNDVINYLRGYFEVPSSAMGKGKYWKSGEGVGASKQDAFEKNYIRSVFNYGEHRINGNK